MSIPMIKSVVTGGWPTCKPADHGVEAEGSMIVDNVEVRRRSARTEAFTRYRTGGMFNQGALMVRSQGSGKNKKPGIFLYPSLLPTLIHT